MKHILTSLLLICLCGAVYADDYLFIVGTEKNGVERQRYFYDQTINTDDIKKSWDEGYRITCASYSSVGWCIIMSQNSGIGAQTYSFDKNWPEAWIEENKKKGMYITRACKGNGDWFIVMSECPRFKSQGWVVGEYDEMLKTVNTRWNKGLRITDICGYDNNQWLAITSLVDDIPTQTVVYVDKSRVKSEIQNKWAEGFQLANVAENSNGMYLMVFNKYNPSVSKLQRYKYVSSYTDDPIANFWDLGYNISYLGGSPGKMPEPAVNVQTQTAQNNRNQNNNQNNNQNINPYKELAAANNALEPNSIFWYTICTHCNGYKTCSFCNGNTLCTRCGGSGQCTLCHGSKGSNVWTGVQWVYVPCSNCLDKMICFLCNGTGKCGCVVRANNPGVCTFCKGEGHILELKPAYASGNAMPGGYTNDNHTSGGNAGGSKGSSKKKCTMCGGSGFGADQITYSPNYTGQDNSQYCTICGRTQPAHTHYKPKCGKCGGFGTVSN